MSDAGGRAFWLCHECGAQMRPIRIDGVRQCASCNSEFIEILDPEVNPDPAYELPPAPPVRPGSQPPPTTHNRPASPPANRAPSVGDLIGNMFGGFFGGGDEQPQPHPHANQQDQQAAPDNPFGRTFQFNIGGGSGSVTFGDFGAGGGGTGMFGPYGQVPGQGPGGIGPGPAGGGRFGPFGLVPEHGGDQGGGLDAFFPGFPPPPPGHGLRHGQGHGPRGGRTTGGRQPIVLQGNDIFGILLNALGGDPGVANLGDYATSEQGFAQILEQLMQAAGPQGPLPATDAVIEGLPRVKLDADAIEKSAFKDCPVCKDDYAPGDEVMRVPCQHIFHVDCLQPWLKTNGSCPVCRFSLVPAEGNRPEAAQSQPSDQQSTGPDSAPTPTPPATGPSGITNILHRLWGQSGSTSQPTSPTTENPPQTIPVGDAESSGQRIYEPPATPPPGSTGEADERFFTPPTSVPPEIEHRARNNESVDGRNEGRSSGQVEERLPSSIPEDYRERHRQREREQNQQRDRDP